MLLMKPILKQFKAARSLKSNNELDTMLSDRIDSVIII